MIEQALLEHLRAQAVLLPFLATYADYPAIFYQAAPSDDDELWCDGAQYGRIIFDLDLHGDPGRILGGVLTVDVMCQKDTQFPEDIEPLLKPLIHGYFFSNGTFVVAAQWKDTSLFTEADKEVTGCTITFELLGFPVLTTFPVDVIDRLNEWSATLDGIHVINHDELPATAWKPTGTETAVYWRLVKEIPTKWIPDTYQTIWRTAMINCHIFSSDIATAYAVARDIRYQLYAKKRLMREGEAPVMVNHNNTVDIGADPLRTGQLTVEAIFGEVVAFKNEKTLDTIIYHDQVEERRTLDGSKEPGIR